MIGETPDLTRVLTTGDFSSIEQLILSVETVLFKKRYEYFELGRYKYL